MSTVDNKVEYFLHKRLLTNKEIDTELEHTSPICHICPTTGKVIEQQSLSTDNIVCGWFIRSRLNFPFVKSIKRQIATKGWHGLTDLQKDAAHNCYNDYKMRRKGLK